MGKYAYPNQTCVVRYSGGTARIKLGQVWYSDHPVVREHPEMFSDEPILVHGNDAERRIEDTEAAPGRKRKLS